MKVLSTVPKESCLPPHGGSGLKYTDESKYIPSQSLPPHGGSGLKFLGSRVLQVSEKFEVSLHTEGVD